MLDDDGEEDCLAVLMKLMEIGYHVPKRDCAERVRLQFLCTSRNLVNKYAEFAVVSLVFSNVLSTLAFSSRFGFNSEQAILTVAHLGDFQWGYR